jgi:PleD family two-component response regulator
VILRAGSGGDEFAILLPETSVSAVSSIVRDIRVRLGSATVAVPDA